MASVPAARPSSWLTRNGLSLALALIGSAALSAAAPARPPAAVPGQKPERTVERYMCGLAGRCAPDADGRGRPQQSEPICGFAGCLPGVQPKPLPVPQLTGLRWGLSPGALAVIAPDKINLTGDPGPGLVLRATATLDLDGRPMPARFYFRGEKLEAVKLDMPGPCARPGKAIMEQFPFLARKPDAMMRRSAAWKDAEAVYWATLIQWSRGCLLQLEPFNSHVDVGTPILDGTGG